MAMIALCLPILPGKRAKWDEMRKRIGPGGDMNKQLNAVREAAGVHERTFLQETPAGAFVVITLEGDNPAEAFGKMMADPAMAEFSKWAADVHGMDPNAPPPPPPELVYDSKA